MIRQGNPIYIYSFKHAATQLSNITLMGRYCQQQQHSGNRNKFPEDK